MVWPLSLPYACWLFLLLVFSFVFSPAIRTASLTCLCFFSIFPFMLSFIPAHFFLSFSFSCGQGIRERKQRKGMMREWVLIPKGARDPFILCGFLFSFQESIRLEVLTLIPTFPTPFFFSSAIPLGAQEKGSVEKERRRKDKSQENRIHIANETQRKVEEWNEKNSIRLAVFYLPDPFPFLPAHHWFRDIKGKEAKWLAGRKWKRLEGLQLPRNRSIFDQHFPREIRKKNPESIDKEK